MSYRTASAEKFTMIDDLLDLDDLEQQVPNNQNSSAIRSQGKRMFNESNTEDKYKKFIRDPYMSHPSSGMLHGNYQQEKEYHQPPQRQHVKVPYAEMGQQVLEEHYEKIDEQQSIEPIKTYTMPLNTPNCLEICDHITNCPICSKFYNTDKTIYIISIVVLIIICFCLVGKIIN
tara:strand:- start:251 stop:772 length:522 start_codon:yes stop_codon:yes gene_type:complete